ncbi:MAG: ribonuclease H-like domain-containing protein [DPANN group archaeon]|nr:ribonuclease H-like domain-containing protein [DPANN group archaeon]
MSDSKPLKNKQVTTDFFITDADYTTFEEKPAIRLYGRTKTGKSAIVLTTDFEPYFYIIPKTDPKATQKTIKELILKDDQDNTIIIKRTDIQQKTVDGKDIQVLKIITNNPKDVPKLKDALKHMNFVSDKREYDIPFSKRYLFDKDIRPMSWLKIKGQEIASNYNCDTTILAETIDKDEKTQDFPKLNILAFDIETIPLPNNKQQIIMASLASSSGLKKVITYQKATQKDTIIKASEKELIEELIVQIQKEKPDFIVTYNGDQFDFTVLKDRADINKLTLNLGFNTRPMEFSRRGMTSAAIIKGSAHIDLYQFIFKVMRTTLKSETLTLDNVANELINEKKLDMDFEEMQRIWKNKEDLKTIAEYNLHDSIITLKLAEYILPNIFAMCHLTNQIPSDAGRSTYGQLVESFAMKNATKLNTIVPNRPSSETVSDRKQIAPIEGAFVVEPTPGLYKDIAVFDFKSLYPSIIVSHNISPETLNCACCKHSNKNRVPGFPYYFCEKEKGFIPEILEELLKGRAKVKAEMKKYDRKSQEHILLDKKQYAFKTVANAFYGYLGFAGSRWYKRECAESVTAFGRSYIHHTIDTAKDFGLKTIYGDSITKNRFVTILDNERKLQIKNIEDLFYENSDHIFERDDKEVVFPVNLKALSLDTNTGKAKFNKINEIIRHKCRKNVFRVNQKFGETCVTEDHSLIAKDKNNNFLPATVHELKNMQIAKIIDIPKLKPLTRIDLYDYLKSYKIQLDYKNLKKIAQVHYNDNFVWFGWTRRKDKILLKRFIDVGTEEFDALCRIFGIYIAEGSSSTPETTKSCAGASIYLGNKEYLEKVKDDYGLLFSGAKASIIRSCLKPRKIKIASGDSFYEGITYKLQMMNNLSAVFFKCMCGQKSNAKKLPQFIYHVPIKYKKILLDAMIDGDGSRNVNKKLGYTKDYIKNNFRYSTISLELMCGLSFLLSQMEINYSMRHRPSKDEYILQTSSKHNSRIITKIKPVIYDNYVYDLSVEGTNTFVDSCGQIVLHNTDSLFLLLDSKEEKTAKSFLTHINKNLPGMMELEFEDLFKSGIFAAKKSGTGGAKKRYALMKESGELKIRGFERVRRDWSSLAKDTQEKVMRLVLTGKKDEATELVKKVITDLKLGKTDLDILIIHNQLTMPIAKYVQMGPHVAAAKKAEAKGLKIEPGTVLKYIITKGTGSISDRAYLSQFAKDYDPDYYINHQILPAALRILSAVGVTEDQLLNKGTQKGLFSFSGK